MRPNAHSWILGVLLPLAITTGQAGLALAQEEPAPPIRVIEVGNTRFVPLFEAVTLAPGQRLERHLDVHGFARLGVVAAATTAPNEGRVLVATLFGPPEVPVPNRLLLPFNGRTEARRGQTMEVMGPRFTVILANQSAQPVEVSLSVYAAK